MATMLFTVPTWTDLVAVSIGSVQGAMFAARFVERRIDLFGVMLVGILAGLGGGILRDLLLTQVVASMSNNWYLPAVAVSALIGMLLLRFFTKINGLIIVLDALAVGMFAAVGTSKAISLGVPAAPAIFIGLIAAVGGSILRDMLLNLPIAVLHVGSLYAVPAAFGAALLFFLQSFGVEIFYAGIACVLLTTAIRLGSVKYGWSLPEQRSL